MGVSSCTYVWTMAACTGINAYSPEWRSGGFTYYEMCFAGGMQSTKHGRGGWGGCVLTRVLVCV